MIFIVARLHTAPDLKGDHPSPVILENVEYHFDVLSKDTPKDKPLAKEHMPSNATIVTISASAFFICELNTVPALRAVACRY